MTVMTHVHTDPIQRLAAAMVPVPAMISGIGRLVGELRRRRTLSALTELDDRMLRDIGLTRGEIREAVARSLTEDSVRTAKRLSAERRARGD